MDTSRRSFIKYSAPAIALAGSISPLEVMGGQSQQDLINVVGPKPGYTPQIGTMVSMMNWMRSALLSSVRNLSTKELDYLHDDESNTVGAMLLHLAATERFYQIHTFDGKDWGDWSVADAAKWNVPMSLGEAGRAQIKGNPLDFYLDRLAEVRESTLTTFKSLDDKWLLSVDEDWGWGPTNNYCKWFHVCEHESNHNGQIKYILSRVS